jgi:hypothetical protein
MKKPNNKIGSWTQIGDVVGAVVADLRLKKEASAQEVQTDASADPCEGVGGSGFAGGGRAGMETVMRLSEALPPIRGPQRVASLTLMTVTHPAFPWLERGADGIWLGHPLGSA